MILLIFACVIINYATATLNIRELPVEKKLLHVPPLEEIAQVLDKGLREHFEKVSVEVTECPDLSQPPFGLANAGLGGDTRLVEVGGVQYIFPLTNFSKVYDMKDVMKILDMNSAFIIGAGSGSHTFLGTNSDAFFNLNIIDGKIDQQTKVVMVNSDGSYNTDKVPQNETRFDILADFFVSKGNQGPVLKVHVQKRTSKASFSLSIRKTLAKHYGSKIVSLGGAFILQTGYASNSISPPFSSIPIYTFADVKDRLKSYNMSAPLIGVGSLITGTIDLDLRLQHFHTFSEHGDSGHYNIDTTPDIAEYLGYFNTVEYVYRIDKPPNKMNRDLDQ